MTDAIEQFRQQNLAKGLDQWQAMANENSLGARTKQFAKKLFMADATVEITEEQAEQKLRKQPNAARYKRKADDFKQAKDDLRRLEEKELSALDEEKGLRDTMEEFKATLEKAPGDRTEVETQLIEAGVTVAMLAGSLEDQEQARQRLTESRRKMEKSIAEVTIIYHPL